MSDATSYRNRAAFPGIMLISMATLLLEISWMRILSVTLWYHFAFLVLSTALFGFGFAGVSLSLRKNAASISPRFIAVASILTPLSFAAGYSVFNALPFEPYSLGKEPQQWLFLPLAYIAVVLPFFMSGVTIAALITLNARRIHILYLFDLAGAGFGALLLSPLLPVLGGTGTVLAAAAIAAAGSALISAEAGKRWIATAASLTALFALLAPFGDALFPVRISANKVSGDGVPFSRIVSDPRFHRFTAWNAISRVDVIEWNDQKGEAQRSVLIDGGSAVTRLANPKGAASDLGPGDDDESFFLRLFSAPRVLVVGSGGGREVLLALRANASSVTAVEINPAINDIVSQKMADFTGRIYDDPRVSLRTDEARSFLRRSKERYDLIHCPHTISNAAVSSGSLSLAENHLMTVEAFDDYLKRLSPDGVLLITRPEAHLPRLFSTARSALASQSIGSLADRAIAWRSPARGLSFYSGFALKRTSFSESEIAGFAEALKRLRLEPLYLPGKIFTEPYWSLARGADLDSIATRFSSILEPATDDKPFFNRRTKLSDIGWNEIRAVFSSGTRGRMALEYRPVAEATLLVLLAEAAAVAFLLIAVPLFALRRRALQGPGVEKTLVAFFALGLAYITVEIGFIQRLTLYLGRPTTVFATVLATLLVSSGVGSAIAGRFKGPNAPWRSALAAASAGLLVSLGLTLVIQATLSWPEPLRIALSVLFLAVPGFAMGMPFPLLMSTLQRTRPDLIPWAFGINGFASVVGTILAMVIAMTYGYTAVLAAGSVFYLSACAASKNEGGRHREN